MHLHLRLTIVIAITLLGLFPAGTDAQTANRREPQKQEQLWKKLESAINDIDSEFDGVLGVAILDLTSGRMLALNADEVFPTASSIKIAVLAELYRQDELAAKGIPQKAKLSDLYIVNTKDLVASSDIMNGLTPGVTSVTNRDLATFMVAVSDNSATNVLIDRLGMQNVIELLDGLGLPQTRLRRKMMDLKAAGEGRENVSTPREMVTLLETIYQGKVFDKSRTVDFFKLLSTHKSSNIPRLIPDDVRIANKPGSLEAVRTDSGIVFVKNRPFAISVMTTYARDESAAEMAISRIALAAYHYFDRIGRSSEYGRVVSPR